MTSETRRNASGAAEDQKLPQVKAEVLQEQHNMVSGSAFNGATAQRKISEPAAEKTGTAPQAAAGLVKTNQQ